MSQPGNVTTALACGIASEMVRTFGGVRLRVFGTSMVPSILPGDLISVQRASLSEIIPGDVVLYSRDDRLYAHRTVALVGNDEGLLLVTRGDRLSYNDPPVSSAELVGRVTSIEARDGRAYRPVQTAAQESVWKQMMVQVLRKSDRATYLYLRIVRLWPTFSSGRAACRA